MGCSVTIRGLQLLACLALRGQGQALLRNRGPGDGIVFVICSSNKVTVDIIETFFERDTVCVQRLF